jgi:hypothetical protein
VKPEPNKALVHRNRQPTVLQLGKDGQENVQLIATRGVGYFGHPWEGAVVDGILY